MEEHLEFDSSLAANPPCSEACNQVARAFIMVTHMLMGQADHIEVVVHLVRQHTYSFHFDKCPDEWFQYHSAAADSFGSSLALDLAVDMEPHNLEEEPHTIQELADLKGDNIQGVVARTASAADQDQFLEWAVANNCD